MVTVTQQATGTSRTKAEHFAAVAARFGWVANISTEGETSTVVAVGPLGARLTLRWKDGTWAGREHTEYRRTASDKRPVRVSNASAARHIMAANPAHDPPNESLRFAVEVHRAARRSGASQAQAEHVTQVATVMLFRRWLTHLQVVKYQMYTGGGND